MANELSLRELESEMAVELPEREALSGVHVNVYQHVSALNIHSAGATTYASSSVNVINVQFRDIYVIFGGSPS
jgi:hypothetical protein